MVMDDAMWMRHTPPWSGWTRMTAPPLLAFAIWSRVWMGRFASVPIVLAKTWFVDRLARILQDLQAAGGVVSGLPLGLFKGDGNV